MVGSQERNIGKTIGKWVNNSIQTTRKEICGQAIALPKPIPPTPTQAATGTHQVRPLALVGAHIVRIARVQIKITQVMLLLDMKRIWKAWRHQNHENEPNLPSKMKLIYAPEWLLLGPCQGHLSTFHSLKMEPICFKNRKTRVTRWNKFILGFVTGSVEPTAIIMSHKLWVINYES